jgi:hypothetical protein
LLRVAKLEHERDGDLACLAPPRPLAVQKQPAGQLLCDRAGPTDDGGLAGVGEGGPGDRQQIHAVMTHEPAVLGGDDRGGNGRRHVLERNPDLDASRLGLERRKLATVDVEIRDRRGRASRQ